MRAFMIALQFLTCIPLSPHLTASEEELGKSMVYFPLVGLCIGGCLALVHFLLAALLPSGVVAGIVVALLAGLSGAIHLDGLADTADGVAGGRSREETLRIMKDPRVGAFGVICLVLVLMLKYGALVAMPEQMKYRALLLVPMLGRWAQLIVAYRSDYAGLTPGIGFTFTRQLSFPMVFAATLLVGACAVYLFSLKGLVVAGVMLGAGLCYAAYFRRTLGGVTGDVLGAATELAEVSALILLLVKC